MSLSAVDESHMQAAFRLALKSRAEGGCPIGAVLVDQASGRVLGQGHNGLVQEGNPIVHGEMAALRAAGRLPNRHRTTLYTTLQPCFMCAGTIAQFGIPRARRKRSVSSLEAFATSPITTRGMPNCAMVPAHMKHGCKVV